MKNEKNDVTHLLFTLDNNDTPAVFESHLVSETRALIASLIKLSSAHDPQLLYLGEALGRGQLGDKMEAAFVIKMPSSEVANFAKQVPSGMVATAPGANNIFGYFYNVINSLQYDLLIYKYDSERMKRLGDVSAYERLDKLSEKEQQAVFKRMEETYLPLDHCV